MPALRTSEKLPAEHPKTPAMPPTDLGDDRHHLRLNQVAAECMVSSHLPAHVGQERHFRNATASSIGNLLKCGMAAMPISAARGAVASAADKTTFVAAVQTNQKGHPEQVKLSVVKGFRKQKIELWVKQHLAHRSEVVSDGVNCFKAVEAAGCRHQGISSGGGRAAVEKPEFYWVNTVLGNLKSAL